MEGNFFRKKSMGQVVSPEQLDDYIRIAGPGAWLLLAGMLLLVLGMCIWGIFGRLETSVRTAAVSRDGVLTCYIPEGQPLSDGMTVMAEGRAYPVSALSGRPQRLGEDTDAYALHLGGLAAGDWVYTAEAQAGLPDGVYEVVVLVGETAPASFLIN